MKSKFAIINEESPVYKDWDEFVRPNYIRVYLKDGKSLRISQNNIKGGKAAYQFILRAFNDDNYKVTNKIVTAMLNQLQNISETSYSFGTKEYTSKNLTPDEILDIAMAYHKENPKKLIGKRSDHNIKVANDLATLLGSTQLEPSKRTGKPILVASLLKNGLVSKEEYIKLFKDLTNKHTIVAKVLSGAKPETKGASKAARVATKDMKDEFGDTDEGVKINEDTREDMKKYRGFPYEIWYTPRRGMYYAIGKGKTAGKIKLRHFETHEEAEEHAELEIEGFLDEAVLDETKVKYAKTVTKADWDKAHKDYKTIIDGEHYMLMNDPKYGTILAPVKLEESSFCENCNDNINESSEPPVIQQLRDIVKTKSYKTIKDPKTGKNVKVDLYSASAVVRVYDGLSDSNKEKFCKMGLPFMVNTSFKILNKK
jgi:hypothetical protein